jgi:hypothetical protein
LPPASSRESPRHSVFLLPQRPPEGVVRPVSSSASAMAVRFNQRTREVFMEFCHIILSYENYCGKPASSAIHQAAPGPSKARNGHGKAARNRPRSITEVSQIFRNGNRVASSVGTILGIDSQRIDSFGDFCGRARRLDSKVKESILNQPRFLCNNWQKTALKPEIWRLLDKKSSQINVDALSKQQITSELNAYR